MATASDRKVTKKYLNDKYSGFVCALYMHTSLSFIFVSLDFYRFHVQGKKVAKIKNVKYNTPNRTFFFSQQTLGYPFFFLMSICTFDVHLIYL